MYHLNMFSIYYIFYLFIYYYYYLFSIIVFNYCSYKKIIYYL